MLDFHTHLLPGVDDGSDSVETSLGMLSHWGAGDCVCATPHFYADRDTPERFLRRRAAAWDALSAALPEDAPRIRLGAEVRYFDGMASAEALPQLCLEGTRLLLLEFPFVPWTARMLEEVRRIRRRGIQPVAAHLERYLGFNRPETLRAFAEELLVQCNAEFFLSRRTRRRALRLLQDGFVQFLGSDAHDLSDRAPNLAQALELIGEKLGAQEAKEIDEEARYWLRRCTVGE